MKSKSFLKNMRKAVAVIAGLLLLLAFAQCKKTNEDQTVEVNEENIELTDNAMEFIDNNIQAQLDLLSDKDIPEVMEALAAWFSEQDGVTKAISYNDSIIITFVDESDAILTIYDRTVTDDIEYDLSQIFPRNGSSSTQEAITIGNHEVFIYDAYAQLSVLDLREGDSIDKYFSECGYEPIHLKDEQCTIESLRNLTQYGYILLATHGLRNSFATREAVTSENRWLYMDDRLNGRLRIGYNVYRNEDGYLSEGKFYRVTKKFIRELDGQFNNAIVFNSSCDGLKGDTPLKRAFLEKGVVTYYGFDGDVYDKYKYYASAFVAKMLLSGYSTGEAAEVFKANFPQASYGTRFDMAGRDDVTWYETPPTSAPVVTTNEVSAENIATTTATVSGSVVFPEPSQPIEYERGFVYGTSSEGLVVGEADQVVYPGTELLNFSCTLTDLLPNTMYYVRAYSRWENNEVIYGDVVSFTTLSTGGDTYDYVDLGLPSGTLWATCNLGANTPEEYGDYFAWGETQPKVNYSWGTYQYCNGDWDQLTKYCSNSNYGYNDYTDNLTILETSDDAATANWGSGWRMPTIEEYNELYQNTIHTWTTQNGVNGNKFTALNGNSVFLPAAGCRLESSLFGADSYGLYWSSSLSTDSPDRAWYFNIISNSYSMSYDYRFGGFSVRPVRSAR